jgi:hypothetical protein
MQKEEPMKNTQNASNPQENRDNTQALDFMIAEYETLRTFRQDLISLGENRFNFFLVILSGTAVSLTWLNQLSGYQDVVYLITAIVIGGMLLLGLTTFARITHRNASIILYTRGMNRIRRYFVENYPNIEEHIILDIYDDQPAFKSPSMREQLPIMLAIINGMIASIGGAVLARVVFVWSMMATVLVGLGSFVILFLAQLSYHNLQSRNRERKLKIYFPTPVPDGPRR